MKSEKPKKTKAPVKRAPTSVKEKLASLFKRKPKAAAAAPPRPPPKKPAPSKKATETAPPKLASTVVPKESPPSTKSAMPKRAAGKRAAAPKKVAIPPILLEGDAPAAPRPSGPGERLSMDFVHDALADGRPFRVLTVVDAALRRPAHARQAAV